MSPELILDVAVPEHAQLRREVPPVGSQDAAVERQGREDGPEGRLERVCARDRGRAGAEPEGRRGEAGGARGMHFW